MRRIWLLLPLLAAGCFGGGRATVAAPPPLAPPPSVIVEARAFAAGLGHPHTLEVVSRPGVASWLIVVTGNLVCGICSHPAGTPTITGRAASETWTPGAGARTLSVTQHPPALRPGVTVTKLPLLTRVVISYPLGGSIPSRDAARARCAGQPTCRIVKGAGNYWFADVHRHLTCGATPAGTYPNPTAACRALRTLDRIVPPNGGSRCLCPLVVDGTPPSIVRGTLYGARLRLSIDACSLCGQAAGAEQAAHALMQ